MSWAIGFDTRWNRDIGYGVPAICDHPDCNEEIDRGLSYVCGSDPYGGDHGCGLYFCSKHLSGGIEDPTDNRWKDLCERCADEESEEWFDAKPDTAEWMRWKLRDWSWQQWRDENPEEVRVMREQLRSIGKTNTSDGAA